MVLLRELTGACGFSPALSVAVNRSSLPRQYEYVFRAKSGNTGLPTGTGIPDPGKTEQLWSARKRMRVYVTRLEHILL